MKKIGFLAVTILLMIGCQKKGETYYNCSYIYKYKNPEYRKLCYVGMSKNNEDKIGLHVRPADTLYEESVELENDYVLDNGGYVYSLESNCIISMISSSTFGLQTAISSISRVEFEQGEDKSFKRIDDNIIDKDPFVEFYRGPRHDLADSAFFNEIIRNNQSFSDYGFVKMK